MEMSRRDVFKALGVIGMAGLLSSKPMLRKDEVLTNEALKQRYRLGKKPARDAVKLKLRDYLDLSKLPTPPDDFGHEGLISDWQVLGNDTVGDCAIAGPMHAVMLWNAEANTAVNINTDCTIAVYSAITGYNPLDPYSDRGSDVQEVASYWRDTGMADADGHLHTIDAYVALEPGNIEELKVAMFLFSGAGIGVRFPRQWMDAFNAGQVWDKLDAPELEGGHYIFGTGFHGGNINVVTWGQNQLLTPAGYEQLCDEAL